MVGSFSLLTGGLQTQSGTWMPFRGGGVHPIEVAAFSPFASHPGRVIVGRLSPFPAPTAIVVLGDIERQLCARFRKFGRIPGYWQ